RDRLRRISRTSVEKMRPGLGLASISADQDLVRWLRNLVSLGLIVAAVVIALATGLSDHSDDYGQVPLPQGGVVHLPAGKVTVYFTQLGDSDLVQQVPAFGFQVTPVGGGAPVPVASENGALSAEAVQRSETIGELGSVAKLDVPNSGDYQVASGAQ